MAAKIFLTGASGYIGGEALYQIAKHSTQSQLRCLVRDAQKAAIISKAHPNVQIVQGDLDDSSLIEQEAKAADVVFHLASTRHEVSSKAIAAGLSSTGRKGPGYWIQISGASMFSGPDIKAKTFGEPTDKEYDDVKDISEIIEVIKSNPARVVDNLVLSQDPTKIKTAILPGPMFYGKGHGPINTTTIQGPAIANYTLKNGHSFMVGKGESVWSNVHIHDLGNLFVLLLEAALAKKEGLWNENGIYLPENGKMSFGDIARLISKAAKDQGLIQSDEVKSLTAEEVDQIMPHGSVLLGTNAKLVSSRARRDLSWNPSGPSVTEDVSRLVKDMKK